MKESDVITSFYLKPEDGGKVSSFIPGQYVTIQINIEGETYTHNRQYSLSDAPGKEYYRISVKRKGVDTPDGKVSNYLHGHVKEGDVLPVSAPAGDFVLNMDSTLPVVLISGGVGITPMMSMLNTLIEQDSKRNVYFVHAAINSNTHAMKEHVKAVENEYEQVKAYTCYSAPTEKDLEMKNFDKEGFIESEWLKLLFRQLKQSSISVVQ